MFRVSNRFACYFRLLKFKLRKNRIQFTPVIAFSKRDYPLVFKLVEYTFNIRPIYIEAFVAKEANKLNQVKIGIRFHPAEITHFKINRLYAYVQQIICEGIHF